MQLSPHTLLPSSQVGFYRETEALASWTPGFDALVPKQAPDFNFISHIDFPSGREHTERAIWVSFAMAILGLYVNLGSVRDSVWSLTHSGNTSKMGFLKLRARQCAT